jgi:hypothetical protein
MHILVGCPCLCGDLADGNGGGVMVFLSATADISGCNIHASDITVSENSGGGECLATPSTSAVFCPTRFTVVRERWLVRSLVASAPPLWPA